MGPKASPLDFKRNVGTGLLLLFIGVSLLFASACTGSRAWEATLTVAARPTLTPTLTPEPTATFTPSPTFTTSPTFTQTPTLSLDVIFDTYSDAAILSRDPFDGYLSEMIPEGWFGDRLIRMGTDPFLRLTGMDSPVVNNLEISSNKAVVFRFKFAPQSVFSMGLDGDQAGRLLYPGEPGYSSLGLNYREYPLVVHSLCDENSQCTNHSYFLPGYLLGKLDLLPDTWYMYTQGFAPGKQFIIKIWDPQDPSRMLTFQQPFDTMADKNNIVIRLDNYAILAIDDFAIIQFTDLLEAQ